MHKRKEKLNGSMAMMKSDQNWFLYTAWGACKISLLVSSSFEQELHEETASLTPSGDRDLDFSHFPPPPLKKRKILSLLRLPTLILNCLYYSLLLHLQHPHIFTSYSVDKHKQYPRSDACVRLKSNTNSSEDFFYSTSSFVNLSGVKNLKELTIKHFSKCIFIFWKCW